MASRRTAPLRHFESTCYHPLLLFNREGDCLAAKLRSGNVHGADGWEDLLLPEIERQQKAGRGVVFCADVAFAKPEVYEALEERGVKYAIRIPANDSLERDIAGLLTRPVGRPSHEPIYSLMSVLLLRDQDREILLLRQQLLILHRQLSRKPVYGRLEKLALLLAGLRLSKRRLATTLLIVQPDTLLRWHRELVRRHWTFRQKRRPGRPPLTEEIQDLVLRLARENPHWGCRKIQGEMLKLGLKVSRSTVVRLLRRHALGPPPDNRRSPTWSQFLGQYKDFVWASDFFTVTTARLRTFYVLFFMELRRRRLMLFNVTEHPDAEWVVQQLRNLSVQHDSLPRFILHDRDGKFSEAFDAFAQASGSKVIKLPPRSPNLNAYAERWVRSVREECLDQIIVLSERHLRYVLKEYVEYFMKRRPHQGLKQQLPDSTEESPATGRIRCRQVLGGLINDYYRDAA